MGMAEYVGENKPEKGNKQPSSHMKDPLASKIAVTMRTKWL